MMAENVKGAAKNIDPSQSPVFAWEAEEFGVYEKTGSWTWMVVIVAVVVAVIFYFQKNWTGMLLSGAAAALISQGHVNPKKIRCAIFDGGIVINDKPHNFGEMKSFWLLNERHPMVRFERVSRFTASVSMPLGKTDPEQVRLFLAKRLPEHEERGEDLSDRISRWFRF